MTDEEAAQAVIALNQAYVAAAADFCRRRPSMAAIYLNMSEDQVTEFASIMPTDLVRLNALPVALVSPLACSGQLLGARSAEDILVATQAAVAASRRGGRSC